MNVDKILDRKYQMTDAGKIDTIRELYTVFSPNVNLEALKKSDFFPALEQMMETVMMNRQIGMIMRQKPATDGKRRSTGSFKTNIGSGHLLCLFRRLPLRTGRKNIRWCLHCMVPATIFFWWKDGALCRRRPGANGSSSFRRWNWMNLCLIF